MVDYTGLRPSDAGFAELRRRQFDDLRKAADALPGPQLDFDWLPGAYVSDHSSMSPVTVTRVAFNGGIKALIYKSPIHEDYDGDPEAYAAPMSATNLSPRGGVMHETSLKNATNQKSTKAAPNPVFHANPDLNTFSWVGVRSRLPTPWDVAGGSQRGRPYPNPAR